MTHGLFPPYEEQKIRKYLRSGGAPQAGSGFRRDSFGAGIISYEVSYPGGLVRVE